MVLIRAVSQDPSPSRAGMFTPLCGIVRVGIWDGESLDLSWGEAKVYKQIRAESVVRGQGTAWDAHNCVSDCLVQGPAALPHILIIHPGRQLGMTAIFCFLPPT